MASNSGFGAKYLENITFVFSPSQLGKCFLSKKICLAYQEKSKTEYGPFSRIEFKEKMTTLHKRELEAGTLKIKNCRFRAMLQGIFPSIRRDTS